MCGMAGVHQHTVQRVRVSGLWLLAHVRGEVQLGVVLHDAIDLAAERTEALQIDGEHVGGLIDREALVRSHLVLALGAQVLVLSVQHLHGCETPESLRNRGHLVDLQAQVQKRIVRVRVVLAARACHLAAEAAAEGLVHKRGLTLRWQHLFGRFQTSLLHGFKQVPCELMRILLAANLKAFGDLADVLAQHPWADGLPRRVERTLDVR
mmetsp:Transcript_17630/g.29625  ORF Transcript_17630/g.29625 Transcript_17630/m.29625 type:complete len:208 (+) Transcript_17630:1030-1653(+)